ncbi:MAG: 4-hydroxythreonine-4-phosphate dehydrogenase PdxA, partial [Ginsengibacter sp.]
KLINFYRKSIGDINFSFTSVRDFYKLNPRQVNIFNCWEEEVAINPGILNDTGGQYAIKSLQMAARALKDGKINALVTAPLHKKNVHGADFSYTGHTPFLKDFFGVNDVLMLLASENLKIGLVTEHVPVKDIATHITRESILSKLSILHLSLKKDFNIDRPKIAVLALNPHAGDEGAIGTEEEEIIKPAIKEAKQHNILVMGPFSADAFFARGQYNKFDAVLAMYHDQGLIPFKSLSFGEGVNFTAGLPGIRTSPDHGTAFDIAGKDKADPSSFRAAIFSCIDILNNQQLFEGNRKNPINRMSANVVAGAVDEKISE